MALFLQQISARSNEWPFYFISPDSLQTEPDSTHLSIKNEFSYHEQLKESFFLNYKKSKDNLVFNQLYEHSVNTFADRSFNQYMDLSGSVEWKDLPLLKSVLGFTYEPQLSYNQRPSGSIFRSNINTGPYYKIRLFDIPVKITAGVSGTVNEELPGDLGSIPLTNYNIDPGLYGGCEIGDTLNGVAGKPLFVNIKLFGKTITGVGSGLVMGKVLYQHEFASGDSMFFYAADSLLNGKDMLFSYQTTPWSINHSLHGALGIKAKKRHLGVIPAAIYSYRLGTSEYPSSEELIDKKKTSHAVNLQMSTIDHFFFDYEGGIELAWDNENHDFRKKSSNMSDEVKNYNDHNSDLASTDHLFRIRFPKNFSIEYELHAQKDSKKYNDTINENENDHIWIRNHLGLKLDSVAGFGAEVYTEYAKTYLYYFRKINSAQSKSLKDYLVGLNISFTRGPLRLEEKIFMDAEQTDYRFKFSSNLPPYSRRISSVLTGNLTLNEHIELSGTWIQKYNDYGYWYGNDYFSEVDSSINSYYAIDSKTHDYSLMFYTSLLFEKFNIHAGVSFRDIIQKNFDNKTDSYLDDNVKGFTVEPSLKFNFNVGFLEAEGKIGRLFDSKDDNLWNANKNWDLILKLNAVF